MAPLLTAFLTDAARRDFVRGRNDCMLFAADWVRTLTGRDPAAACRGVYDTEAGANAIISAAGGPEQIIDDNLRPLGWHRVSGDTARGDIALVAPPGHEPTAGVAVGAKRIALLSHRGLVVWPLPVIAAWRHG